MRFRTLAMVAAAALLAVPAVVLGQSLAEAAATEKARRKALQEAGKKPARSYSDEDLGRASGANASFPSGPDAAPADPAATSAEGGAEGAAKPKEKTDDDRRAEATAAWQKRFEAADKEVTTIQAEVNRIQADLNDTSGGFYSARRNSLMSMLEEKKKQLAEAEQKRTALDEERRQNGY
jgi:hypothetical protein